MSTEPHTVDTRGDHRDDSARADSRVLGQLLAAQNMLSVLPTAKHIADFYAVALAGVPGLIGARVCFPGAIATDGSVQDGPCTDCLGRRALSERLPIVVKGARCELAASADNCVVALETVNARFGYFVLQIGRAKEFDLYRPFVANMANSLALVLENRLHQSELQRARDVLERRVHERTEELRAINQRLEEEIQERKQAEAAVRDLNMALEQRVRDRTVQLEAANKELEAFAYSASHDLRAPLRHIIGFMELLRPRAEGALDEQSKHYMKSISDAATRMGRLIDDLLAFSRLGRSELDKGEVDLSALVQEVIRDLEPDTRGRSVAWNLGPLPVVAADRAMLRVALANLLANALKFTRPRDVAQIDIGQSPSDESELVFFVRDNGVGFDPKYSGKLFRVFERLHRETEFEGTGIGLANVRRVIMRHGGRTWAEGALDKGATFYFSLPKAALPA